MLSDLLLEGAEIESAIQKEVLSQSNHIKVAVTEIKDCFDVAPSVERKDPVSTCKRCGASFVLTSLQKLRSHIAGKAIFGTRLVLALFTMYTNKLFSQLIYVVYLFTITIELLIVLLIKSINLCELDYY